jgi:hypothetical protein
MEGVSIPKVGENKIMHIGKPMCKDNVLVTTGTLESLGQNRRKVTEFFRSKPRVPSLELPLDRPLLLVVLHLTILSRLAKLLGNCGSC